MNKMFFFLLSNSQCYMLIILASCLSFNFISLRVPRPGFFFFQMRKILFCTLVFKLQILSIIILFRFWCQSSESLILSVMKIFLQLDSSSICFAHMLHVPCTKRQVPCGRQFFFFFQTSLSNKTFFPFFTAITNALLVYTHVVAKYSRNKYRMFYEEKREKLKFSFFLCTRETTIFSGLYMVGEYHFESRCSEDDQPNRAGRWGNVMPRAKTEILLELYKGINTKTDGANTEVATERKRKRFKNLQPKRCHLRCMWKKQQRRKKNPTPDNKYENARILNSNNNINSEAFLERERRQFAQPAKPAEESKDGRNSEPVEKPRFPRRALLGAVNPLLDFLAGQFTVVGTARFQVAQQTFLAIGVATGAHRRRFPIISFFF